MGKSKKHWSTYVANVLIKRLKRFGASIDYETSSKNVHKMPSIYIKFDDFRIPKVRISDHQCKREYIYIYNLILKCRTCSKTDRGVVRYYYNEKDLWMLVRDVKRFAKKLREKECYEKHS